MAIPARHNQRSSRARGALGLFAVVWLNLILQPCAMAAEAGRDRDCPRCPPAEMHEHHDGHTGTNVAMPCAQAASDCILDVDVNHDGRNGQVQLKGGADAVPAAAYDVSAAARAQTAVVLPQSRGSAAPGAPPPLHILNCVYLD